MRLPRATATYAFAVLLLVGGTALAQNDGDKSERRARIRERLSKDDNAPKVGDLAPSFKLKSLDGKSETDLSSYKGKKPVILFFGSYT